MTDYRAYKVGHDGHFVGFEPIICDTDVEAIEQAKSLLRDRPIELWCRQRMVATLDPEKK